MNDMSTIDAIVIWGNFLGCLVAIAANYAAAHVGFLIHRSLAIVIAVLAAIYATGYALLLTGVVEFARWSQFFRGVSLIVWPLVWAGPAIMSIAAWHHASRQVQTAVKADTNARERDRC